MFKPMEFLQMKNLNHYASALTRFALVGLTSFAFSPFAIHQAKISSQAIHPAAVVHAPTESVIYVDKAATGSGNGSSWDNAYTSLQDGLNHAGTDDQIWVAQGIYTPTVETSPGDPRSVSFTLVNGVEIYGGFSGEESLLNQRDLETYETILSGDLNGDDDGLNNRNENCYHVVSSGTGIAEDTVLDGFTIRNGNSNGSGGGVYNNSGSPWMANLLITSNTAIIKGGGMYNYSSEPVLFNVKFYANISNSSGGAMYNQNSDPYVASGAFFGNTAQNGAGIYNENSHPSLMNCLFSGNIATNGGGIYNASSSILNVVNATFSHNLASNGGGIYNDNSVSTVRNSILWGNSSGQITHISGSFNLQQSLIQNDCPTGVICAPRIITTDPFFVDPDGPDNTFGTLDDNLHLKFSSPAIDAGDNLKVEADYKDLNENGNTAEKVPFDLDQRPRFVDIVFVTDYGVGSSPFVDIGAIETRVVYVKTNTSGDDDGRNWANAYRTLSKALEYSIGGDELWVAQGVYTPTLPGASTTLSDTFKIKQGLVLYAGFTGNEISRAQRNPRSHITTLSGDLDGDDDGFSNNGDNCYHVVTMTNVDSSTILDGFTIQGGNATEREASAQQATFLEGLDSPWLMFVSDRFQPAPDDHAPVDVDPILQYRGGGMYLNRSSPLLIGLSFIKNYGLNGGGLYNYFSDPIMINCTWIENKAENGAGLRTNNSYPLIVNALFLGNKAALNGGGIWNSCGSPTIINSTFYYNTVENLSVNRGDAIVSDRFGCAETVSHPELTNTIMWNNGLIPIRLNDGSEIDFNYSLLEFGCPTGGATCSNLLSSDPLFFDPIGPDLIPGTLDDDLHLAIGSPAMDTGDNAAVPDDLFDIDENNISAEKLPYDLLYHPRFQGVNVPPIVDRGAYETRPKSIFLPVIMR